MTLSKSLNDAAQIILDRLPPGARPTVGLVLGSGLGAFADTLERAVRMSYVELSGFPVSRIEGHSGNLVYGLSPGGLEVLVMQGRAHYYEGHDLATVAFPVQVLVACGCRTIVLTNAAGGIRADLRPGQLVLISDHLNLMAGSPLRGENDAAVGLRFPDMSAVYDAGLRSLAGEAGRSIGLELTSGVYAGCIGPQYETPAEIRMLRGLGADLVGMSTVPEAIAARHMGARVLGISCVTNLAAGIAKQPLSHAEVTETAALVSHMFQALLSAVLRRLAAEERYAGA
jgi:purine-nucleoside phosphorylase